MGSIRIQIAPRCRLKVILVVKRQDRVMYVSLKSSFMPLEGVDDSLFYTDSLKCG